MKEHKINRTLKIGQWHSGDEENGQVSILAVMGDRAVCGRTENANQTRDLFRYLGGIVLPKVERETRAERMVVNFSSADLDAWVARDAHVDFKSGEARFTGKVTVFGSTIGLTPEQARALAAMLLVAADEVETKS